MLKVITGGAKEGPTLREKIVAELRNSKRRWKMTSDPMRCKRAHVKCLITSPQGTPLATGENGPLPSRECSGEPGRCGCMHAEQRALNVLHQSGYEGPIVIAITHSPCALCALSIIDTHNSGNPVDRVLYGTQYRSETGMEALRAYGIPIMHDDRVFSTLGT